MANVSAMYAVYHGPGGLKRIATRINSIACAFACALELEGFSLHSQQFFDTVTFSHPDSSKHSPEEAVRLALVAGYNIRHNADDTLTVAFDETSTESDLVALLKVLTTKNPTLKDVDNLIDQGKTVWLRLSGLHRVSAFLQHTVFNSYQSEMDFQRWLLGPTLHTYSLKFFFPQTLICG